MRPRDAAELVALAALWGAAFLFMRVAVPAFGPVALAFLRVAGAAMSLLPLLALRGDLPALRRHWRPIAAVGFVNSALPFLCFAYAARTLDAGLSSILNSASPLFAALIAWAWLGDRLTAARVAGLVIGFAGVVWIAWHGAGLQAPGAAVALAACVLAAACYGYASAFTKRHLTGVPPMAVAAGSQAFAAAMLAPAAAAFWPAAVPPPAAWATAAVLAVACTGIAYILYFRLIANAGPVNAIAVTFLIPIFAVVWGEVFLGEHVTLPLAIGCAVVCLGTALATGLLRSVTFVTIWRRLR